MTQKVVAYDNGDGGVTVYVLPHGAEPVIVDADSLPPTRENRSSWRLVDGQVVEG